MKFIRQLIQSILGRFGFQIVYFGKGKKAPPDPLNAFLIALRDLGFNPTHIVDVGANRGQWTRTVSRYFPKAHYTLVEPQARFRDRVNDLEQAGISLTWVNAGAGDCHGRMKLSIPYCDTSASFVPILESSDGQTIETVEVDVLTVDEIVEHNPHGVPEMVKIDAEGFDLRVLKGAGSLHGKTEIFLLEMAVFDGKADNTLARTVRIMEDIGYTPLDVTDLNRCAKSGVLWLVEIPFLRNGSPLWAKIPPYLAAFKPD